MPQISTPQDDAPGRLAERILCASGVMVGACATLVGLVKILEPTRGASRVDEYAGVTAVTFVFCALVAYVTLRLKGRPALQRRLELIADVVFMVAMVALGAIGVMFAYDVIYAPGFSSRATRLEVSHRWPPIA